jgi:hypothetical protein
MGSYRTGQLQDKHVCCARQRKPRRVAGTFLKAQADSTATNIPDQTIRTYPSPPLGAPHTRAVPSSDALASMRPSGLKAAHDTGA